MSARACLVTCLLVALSCWSACSGPEPRARGGSEPSAAPSTPAAADNNAIARPDLMATPTPPPVSTKTELATFGSGCFWCTEAVLETLPGVLDVVSGYAGGSVEHPTYEQVCSGTTGHAEVVQVTFDPARISFDALLAWFFKSHDPTTLNAQGPDEGTQYRSVVFFHSEAQRAATLAAIAKAQPRFGDPIVTEVTAAPKFWPAEAYHQDYFRNNPGKGYCRAMIAPKLKKLGLDKKQ